MKTNRFMYNETQKMQYLNDAASSDNTARAIMSVFQATAPFEEEKDADICTFTHDEIAPVLDKICGIQSKSRYNRTQILRRYARWAVDHEIKNAKNEIGKIKSVGLTRIKETMFFNPEHLQNCLDMELDQESDHTQDNIIRCFFWLAYGGMSEEVIHLVTADDVHINQMVVVHGDSVAVLYRQGLEAVQNCAFMTQFLYNNPAYVNVGSFYRDRVPGSSILRGIRGTSNIKSMRSAISRRLSKPQNSNTIGRFTYNHAWLSGVFYRIYEKEIAGHNPDFVAIAMSSDRGKNVMQTGSTEEQRKKIVTIAREFEVSYSNWREVIVNL